MDNQYPDLEIYIKRIELDAIVSWLSNRLAKDKITLVKTEKKKNGCQCIFHVESSKRKDSSDEAELEMRCVIMDKAAKGGFVSVWFKTNRTPWLTDSQCAEEAFNHFGAEVRCSTGPWEGNDEGGWLRFTDEGKQVVNWLT